MTDQIFDRRAILGGVGLLGVAALGGCAVSVPTYRIPYRVTTQIRVAGRLLTAVGGGVIEKWQDPKDGITAGLSHAELVSGGAGIVDLGDGRVILVTLSGYLAASPTRWVVANPWDPTRLALRSLALKDRYSEDGSHIGLADLVARASEVSVTLTGHDMPIVVLVRPPRTLEAMSVVDPDDPEQFLGPGGEFVSSLLELKPPPNTIPAVKAALPWLVTRGVGSLALSDERPYPTSLDKESFYQEPRK